MDDGRGARAAALAESLGVIMNTVPQIAKMEGDNAFEAGMRARIDGVQRENSQTANKSMLGFMFSQRARDGFDYQDAQLELPLLQSEELLDMESRLRESRNPEDFRAYIAERDAAIQQRLEGKSDMYRYTVAEALMKTREDHAKLFTQWVVSNRGADRAAAAKAAAKAAAEAQAVREEAAELESSALARGVVVDGETLSTSGTTVSSPSAASSGSVGGGGGGGSASVEGGGGGISVTGTASVGTGTGGPQEVPQEQPRLIPAPPNPAQLTSQAWEEYVTSAPAKFGITTKEAKENLLESYINRADELNDERSLEHIPRNILNNDQHKKLNAAIDTIRNQRLSREAEDAAAQSADAKAQAAAIEGAGKALETDVSTQVALRQMTTQQAINELRSDPFYRDNPEEAAKAIDRLNKINNAYSDPAMEAFDINQFQELVIRRVSQGHIDGVEEALKETLTLVASDAGRAKIVDIYMNAEKWARDQIFDGLKDVQTDITQTFPSGIGQSEQTVAGFMSGQPVKQSYPPEAATRVQAEWEKHMIGLSGDWYTANPDMPSMPHATKLEIAAQAYNLAVEWGQRRYGGGGGTPSVNATPQESADYLRSIAGD